MSQWQNKLRSIFYPYRIFSFLAFFFLIGVLAGSFLNLNFKYCWVTLFWVVAMFIYIGLVNFYLHNQFLVLCSFGTICLVIGLFLYSGFDFALQRTIVFDREVEISGVIATRPQVDATSQKVTLEIKNFENQKPFRILVTLPHYPLYEYGDNLTLRGKLTEPQNFADFDYQGYLKRYFVVGLIKQPTNVIKNGAEKGASVWFVKKLYQISKIFEDSLNSVLPEPHASLAAGILLGVKRNIPDNLMNNLNATGLTHIIALSGYNVTIIVMIFSYIFLPRLGRKKVLIWGTILIFFFVVMTGASASVVRAAIFSFLILLGNLFGRKADQTNLMLLAAILMVCVNPYILRYDSGFQLSFLAFAGLIYLAPIFQQKFNQIKSRYFPEGVKLVLAETLGAQVAVFPLIWWQFGRVSIIAPLANILVVPLIPLVMLLIFAAGSLNLTWSMFGKIGLVLLWPLLQYIIWIVGLLASLPLSSITKQ